MSETTYDKTDEALLIKALQYLWNLRQRGDPVFVYIDYTTRRKVRGILGRKLCRRLQF